MINKTIWTYWHQGFEDAPFLVRRCVDEWIKLHPDWNIVQLDSENISDYVEPLPISEEKIVKMKIAHRSDLIRTQLLIKYGGVWADPTTFPILSLDKWLIPKMESGIFLFQNPGRDRIIANWFIAADSSLNMILIELYDELVRYWQNNEFKNLGTKELTSVEKWLDRLINRNHNLPLIWFHPLFLKYVRLTPYMVYHYMFYKVIQSKNQYKDIFSKMPCLLANDPHRLKRIGLLNPVNDEVKSLINNNTIPLFKLDWRISLNGIPEKSVLSYLFNKNR